MAVDSCFLQSLHRSPEPSNENAWPHFASSVSCVARECTIVRPRRIVRGPIAGPPTRNFGSFETNGSSRVGTEHIAADRVSRPARDFDTALAENR